ncbi:MAG: hypothetical protein CMH20_00225 [Methylophaga sp.]|jgi:hypothetical protein|nr:hypothetical protein [Methylophaga sp.]|tara:strand:+ start:971 stop:1117 length:147 start_codon:yes stop_codon:yes gene_type:complete
MIRKVIRKGKKPVWVLYSKRGDRKLGEYPTREAALERERQIQYFKNKQ